jgi:hypothetical protein
MAHKQGKEVMGDLIVILQTSDAQGEYGIDVAG